MKYAWTRASAWVSLGLSAFVSVTGAQSLEIFAGGARFADVPGTSINVSPEALAIGPDGSLFVGGGRLLRYEPDTGTVTALPATPGGLNYPLGYPSAMAVGPDGDLYVATLGALFRIDVAAGTSENVGYMDSAKEMKFAPDGTLYYIGAEDDIVHARLPSGESIVVAGTIEPGFSGDGGPAAAAQLASPHGLAFGPDGDLYIADTSNNRIRKVSLATGIISTVAGTGEYSFNGDGLPALQTNVSQPWSVAFDAGGNLHVGAWGDRRILRIDAASGLVSTIAGTGGYGYSGDGGPAASAKTPWPRYLAFTANGDLYFADYKDSPQSSHNVRRISASTGIVTRVIGNDTNYFCGEGGPPRGACLANPRGIDVDNSGRVLIADSVNMRVRRTPGREGPLATIATAGNNSIFGIEHDAAGNVFFTTWGSYRVHRIDAATGVVTPFAGTGGYASGGDGGPALSAGLAAPSDVAVDGNGNVYIADTANHRIRKVDISTGTITTYAGMYNGPFSGDGGPASAAYLNNPMQIDFDPAGNLVISDGLNCRLRRVDQATGIINTIAGNGTCGATLAGENGPATAIPLNTYQAFAFDPAGNIFIALAGGQLRRISAATGLVTTVPVPAGGLKTPEGLTFKEPKYMEFDAAGYLYVVDTYQNYVFRVSGLLDATPPVIEPVISGTAGPGGWYRSDVHVTWDVSDPESGVRTKSGCTSSSVTEDTAGITFTCTATSIGGTATQSVTVRRDTVAPTLQFAAALPAPDADGWHHSDVEMEFTAQDALSGVLATSPESPLRFTTDGANQTRNVTVTDLAGNAATFASPAVNIDRSAPLIEDHVIGLLGNAGWYRGDVQVSWTVTDAESGVVASDGCEATTLASDTAGITLTCSVTSHGGAASRSITVKRDATPPTLQWGAFSPLPNASGWNKTNVSVPFTRADATSGIANTSVASPLVISTEGAAVTGEVTVTDNAGNSQTFTTAPRNIDKSAPVISITAPANGASYGFYQDVVADFACTDVSLVSCTGTNADGTLVNTKTAGTRTFKVTAKDAVALTNSVTNTFTVASTFNFDGFLGAAPSPAPNIVRKGSLVPLRWRLPDGNGGYVTSTASFSSVASTTVSCPAGAVSYNDTATGGSGISFSPATNAFTYNWQSSSSFTGCKQIFITLKDGSQHDLVFKFQ